REERNGGEHSEDKDAARVTHSTPPGRQLAGGRARAARREGPRPARARGRCVPVRTPVKPRKEAGLGSSYRRRKYVQHNLVSDGFLPAGQTDSQLVNAWGLTS